MTTDEILNAAKLLSEAPRLLQFPVRQTEAEKIVAEEMRRFARVARPDA
jgi:hypothetical protein